jgi:membrane-bound inhibitor of C-type lysozyme
MTYAELTVKMGPQMKYTAESGEHFIAQYGSLSDSSLFFVKVLFPNQHTYTLPQSVSASGVRYSDDKNVVWWEHQGAVRVDIRGADGTWQTKFPALHVDLKTK